MFVDLAHREALQRDLVQKKGSGHEEPSGTAYRGSQERKEVYRALERFLEASRGVPVRV